MNTLELLLSGFGTALSIDNFFAAAVGALLGILVGAMPGIGSLAGVALLLPLTFKFNPVTGIIMLSAVYYANMYGGSYSAILINIPGDTPAVMTGLDGHPLAQQGKPGKALFTSNIASFIGGTIGIVILTVIGPGLARFGLRFGPVEMAALLLVAMISLGWFLGDGPTKGIVATLLGILMATMGFDAVLGTPRYDFGSIYLLEGIPFIPLVIGIFGFSQVIEMMEFRDAPRNFDAGRLTLRDSLLSRDEFKRILPPSLRSSLLGTFIGVLPGAGATTGAFLSYMQEKRLGKDGHLLGTGRVEGVAAAEAGNNSAAAGAFASLLSLGIPGSGTGTVLLGGLLMYGLNPGPLLFQNQPEFTWGLIASLYVANIVTLAVAIMIIPWLIKILKVPVKVMIPVITTICVIGAYSANNSLFGIVVMLVFGVVGFFMKKYGYPIAPLLLAFVLGPTLEKNFRQALQISDGSLLIFLQRPIAMVLVGFLLITVVSPIVRKLFGRYNTKEKRGSV